MQNFLDSLNKEQADDFTRHTSSLDDQEWQTLLNQFITHANEEELLGLEANIADNSVDYCRHELNQPPQDLDELEKKFSSVTIPELPVDIGTHVQHLSKDIFRQVIPVSSPTFVGHMTSALPRHLPTLGKVLMALNQNVVKLETSHVLTVLERQVLGMMHKLVYNCDDTFYKQWLHSGEHALATFCSGGTVANLTAMWACRNQLMPANGDFAGLSREGLARGLNHYGYNGLAILVSELGHYSLKKTIDVLGLGQDALISVEADKDGRICIDALLMQLQHLRQRNIKPMAIVGIAGTTETGSIDPLNTLADIAEQEQCHFHVDAAWGGSSLLSARHQYLFKGIERADTVAIDAHKQMYVPMGAGMVLFRQPTLTEAIAQHANYIVRKGSKDLGRHTLEGSRSAMSLMLYSNFHLLGRQGFAHLIDASIEKARQFANLIRQQDDFELISEPQLCLLTYRYAPALVRQLLRKGSASVQQKLHDALNALNQSIQTMQWSTGKCFVSRTCLKPVQWDRQPTVVLRVVLANPLTTQEILENMLEEQRQLAQQSLFWEALQNLMHD
ncbi:pyridoxal-dependent aspartate 1-decarboxylase PanP [Xenorhabdus hominickii]|uniref:Glutamate decarboxylase n=1 Tax=Xenorhabdus hominickii TaxID=351679 RepID=A0A2G0Q351_XENHO|nr:putative pyridoxal-dependent aspartate 1-decarboxylase [Xenorhabdus hominickii]AOM39861.1 glutamate decarboxylase [Xenorhabdus hominickii]PHM53648.1 putative decarboxylase involved in desferrioxamine biosynthesis [Xenorhabdus hominickii]